MKYAASSALVLALALGACGPKDTPEETSVTDTTEVTIEDIAPTAGDVEDAVTDEPVETTSTPTSSSVASSAPVSNSTTVAATPPETEVPLCTGANCNTGGNGRPIEELSATIEAAADEISVAPVSATVTVPSFDASGAAPPSCEGDGCSSGGNGRPIEDVLGAAAQAAQDAVAGESPGVGPTCEGDGCSSGGNGRPIEDVLGNAAQAARDAVADTTPTVEPTCEGEGCSSGGNGRPIEDVLGNAGQTGDTPPAEEPACEGDDCPPTPPAEPTDEENDDQ